jgi:small subunit ribosomal protein S8
MQTDPLGDFLTQIRNANSSPAKVEVVTHYSKMKSDVASILQEEGYIASSEMVDSKDNVSKSSSSKSSKSSSSKKSLKVTLKKGKKELKPIQGIKRVSKPGLRIYVSSAEVPKVLGGLGIAILSTPKGIITGHEAKKQNVGGEVLLYVW